MHTVMPSVKFSAAESGSTADSVPLNLTLRHCWVYEAPLLPSNAHLKSVLDCSESLYARSDAQCQIPALSVELPVPHGPPDLTMVQSTWASQRRLKV